MKNKDATLHYLLNEERQFFILKFEEVNNKLMEIAKAADLEGKWTLSEDFNWLVKVKE